MSVVYNTRIICKECFNANLAARVPIFYFHLHSRSKLSDVPKGMAPAIVSEDGDCLFHSVSVALVGDEALSDSLRLGATLWGVGHLEHYVDMVSQNLYHS